MRGHSILVECAYCHSTFRTHTSRVNAGVGKFCSRACGWAGGKKCTIPMDVRLWRSVVKSDDGCWLRTEGVNAQTGYSQLRLAGSAHRLALEERLGFKLPDGFFSLHVCDVRNCIRNDEPGIYVIRGIARPRFGHLWLGTQADNMADMYAKGRGPIGNRHGTHRHPEVIRRGVAVTSAKLTEPQVREIRHRYATNSVSLSRLGQEYGVSPATVSQVVLRKTWQHVE